MAKEKRVRGKGQRKAVGIGLTQKAQSQKHEQPLLRIVPPEEESPGEVVVRLVDWSPELASISRIMERTVEPVQSAILAEIGPPPYKVLFATGKGREQCFLIANKDGKDFRDSGENSSYVNAAYFQPL
ncbi:MAG: hypothetical protein PHS53_00575 [Candidatus Pacebacteria bacterium]|nr:hypothetical protein [Candidatus Paceibacterota bacterium]